MNEPTQLRDDIAFVRAMTEAAAFQPLSHGPHFLAWGLILTGAYLLDWTIENEVLPLPIWSISLTWIAVLVLGSMSSLLIGRYGGGSRLDGSLANRLVERFWHAAGIGLVAVSLSAIFAIAAGVLDPRQMDMFSVMTILIYAACFSAGGYTARQSALKVYLWFCYAASAGLIWLIGHKDFSLAAAVAMVVCVVLPGLTMMSTYRGVARQ